MSALFVVLPNTPVSSLFGRNNFFVEPIVHLTSGQYKNPGNEPIETTGKAIRKGKCVYTCLFAKSLQQLDALQASEA